MLLLLLFGAAAKGVDLACRRRYRVTLPQTNGATAARQPLRQFLSQQLLAQTLRHCKHSSAALSLEKLQ